MKKKIFIIKVEELTTDELWRILDEALKEKNIWRSDIEIMKIGEEE